MRAIGLLAAVFCMYCFSSAASGFAGVFPAGDDVVRGVSTIEDLDLVAVFSFAVMSDNKGDSPSSSPRFAHMAAWMEQSGDRFVIGLGDHVKKGMKNSFLPFIRENTWWHENFYPCVADGENEYYGRGQDDWGAGGAIFREIGLAGRPTVTIRENGCEYYARIQADGFTIHLIQLHFPDEPAKSSIAFPKESRRWLAATLQSIHKGPKDIVIACAHSRYGFWNTVLSNKQRKTVMEKCDLVFSATTHYWERIVVRGYEHDGALLLNTGSITFPRNSPYGYVEVHVLENPLRLVAQYIDADREKRLLRDYGEYAYVKVVGGPVAMAKFRK